jgi:hypothetical protein
MQNKNQQNQQQGVNQQQQNPQQSQNPQQQQKSQQQHQQGQNQPKQGQQNQNSNDLPQQSERPREGTGNVEDVVRAEGYASQQNFGQGALEDETSNRQDNKDLNQSRSGFNVTAEDKDNRLNEVPYEDDRPRHYDEEAQLDEETVSQDDDGQRIREGAL